jgi:cyclopropane fatty-acyl-phospholipid synthase-like methyltransferase
MNKRTESKEVRHLYTNEYFLEHATGHDEYKFFRGRFDQLLDKFKMVVKLLNLKAEDNLLDIGCGRGELVTYHALTGGNATGVDFSSDAINLAREKASQLGADCKFINQSFEEIDESIRYDKIISLDFIEHISADEGKLFFKKCYNTLNPGGRLVVYTFPNTIRRKYGYKLIRLSGLLKGKPVPEKEPDTIDDHYKFYHLNEQNYFSLKKTANEAGFKNVRIEYFDPSTKESFFKKLFERTLVRHLFMRGLTLIADK